MFRERGRYGYPGCRGLLYRQGRMSCYPLRQSSESRRRLRGGAWGNFLQNYLADAMPAERADASDAPYDDVAPPEPRFDTRKDQARKWARHCAKFRTPDHKRAYGQIATTVVPLIALPETT